MTSLLIRTVGTGTAGKHSDVAQELANTIRQIRPRKFWLVPSDSEKSTPVAALIRETVADLNSFAFWSESAPTTPSRITTIPRMPVLRLHRPQQWQAEKPVNFNRQPRDVSPISARQGTPTKSLQTFA